MGSTVTIYMESISGAINSVLVRAPLEMSLPPSRNSGDCVGKSSSLLRLRGAEDVIVVVAVSPRRCDTA